MTRCPKPSFVGSCGGKTRGFRWWDLKEGRCLGSRLMQHAVICSCLLKTRFINLIGWKRLLFFFANYSDSWISGPRHYVYKPLVFHLYFDLPGWIAPGEGPIGQAGPTDRKKNDPRSLAGNRVLTSIRCKLRTKLTSKSRSCPRARQKVGMIWTDKCPQLILTSRQLSRN